MLNLSVVNVLTICSELEGSTLIYNKSINSRVIKGSTVGCVNTEGYRVVTINRVQYKLHRLQYCIYHGLELEDIEGKVIDHLNGNRLDNSKCNLILTNSSGNNSNTTKHRAGKLSGATYCNKRGKWRARKKVDGKTKHLGWFDSELSAHSAYCCARLLEQFS